MWKRISVSALLIAALAILFFSSEPRVSYAAGGSGPGDALLPIGELQTVPPHSGQWYRFDVGGGKASVQATLDASSPEGLRLSIYTPEQVAFFLRGDELKAIGNGAPQQDHTLGWDGVFNQAGTYYAVVYNDTDAPIDVKLRVVGDAVTTSVEPTPTRRPDPLVTPTPLGKGITGKLAFIDASGGNLYTVNGDGTNLQRVSFGLDPQWNHAGTQIALARQGPVPGIVTINPDGSNERMLFGTNEPRSPDWSPDDSRLVFSYKESIKDGRQFCFRGFCFSTPGVSAWKLGSVNLSDGSFRDVKSSGNAFTPTANADGETIAYNDLSIGLMKTTWTGDPQPDSFIGDLRITSKAYNPLRIMSPQFSPDGTQIVYMVMQNPTWQIAIANSDGSNQHLLTSNNVLAYYHPSNVSPVWSPDGKQILFLSDRNGKWEFFTMNLDGTNVQQVLKNVTDQINIKYDFQSGRMMSWAK